MRKIEKWIAQTAAKMMDFDDDVVCLSLLFFCWFLFVRKKSAFEKKFEHF